MITLHPHGGFAVNARGKWRCSSCGHRLTVDGIAPRATRWTPPWRWHLELIDREVAKALAEVS